MLRVLTPARTSMSGTVSGHAPADAIIIPDAHLLFNGDFKRAGVDLVVSGDDHEVVLHDYFKGEKRAALASPDGAHLTGDIINALTGHTQFAQADGSASVGPGHRSRHQADGNRDRDPQRRLDHPEPGRQRQQRRRGRVRLRLDARHHLHRRHRVRPRVERQDGAERNDLRPQRVGQQIADQPGGRARFRSSPAPPPSMAT